MNHWTQLSIDFANQKNYLDELFKIKETYLEYSIYKIYRRRYREIIQKKEIKTEEPIQQFHYMLLEKLKMV